MSILPQPGLFSWQEVEATREISRLTRLLDVLPDQQLLDALDEGRAGKRNDYPLAALWRATKKRAAIERVNSRIDQVYGFERHFIRGKAKVRLRLGLGLLVMLGTAAAWVELKKPQNARSLIRAA